MDYTYMQPFSAYHAQIIAECCVFPAKATFPNVFCTWTIDTTAGHFKDIFILHRPFEENNILVHGL